VKNSKEKVCFNPGVKSTRYKAGLTPTIADEKEEHRIKRARIKIYFLMN
jgi:hypothetical protein